VITYTGTLTGTPTFAWSGAGLSAVFDTSAAGSVQVTLTESTVVGADVLSWTGSASAAWDFAASNWLGLGGVTVYEDGDTVRFEGSPSTRSITLAVPVAPASVVFDSSANWTLSGAGSITGETTLVKRAAGTASLGTSNTYTGGTRIEEGTLAASHSAAFGSGPVTIAGGTLATGTRTIPNTIIVDGTARITGGDGGGAHGIKAVSGSGVLTLEASNVFDLEGSFATFTGRVAFTGSSSFRFFGGAGSSFADFDLGTRPLSARSGTAFTLGSLSGQAGSSLSGAGGSNNNVAVTYTIGANNHDTVFSGAINNGNAATLVVKTGSGRLTLAGVNTYTGNTTVSAGTLAVTGSLDATAVSVSSGAMLAGVGSLGGSLTLASGARLATPPGEDALTVTGDVTLDGPVAVEPEGGEFEIGTHLVLRYQGTLTGGIHWAWAAPADSNLQGTFDLSTRVLTALEQWRLAQLGTADPVGLASDAADPDEDGLSNLLEYALGGDPIVADTAAIMPRPAVAAGKLTLAFARVADPVLVYEVEATSDLQATEWTVVWSSTGASNVAGPITVADTAELAGEPRRFLRLRVR
jgi:autotransporter-associated beta strand protein